MRIILWFYVLGSFHIYCAEEGVPGAGVAAARPGSSHRLSSEFTVLGDS